MDDTPNAAGAAPAPQTEAQPINTQPAAPAQEMHGFTSDQLAEMRRFYDANGGFDKIKAKISNPTPVQQPQPAYHESAPSVQPQQPSRPEYIAPAGSITKDEWMAKQYFEGLSREKQFESISSEVESGAILKDMVNLGIRPINQDGTFNDMRVREFLSMKAQIAEAKQTSSVPEASAAPTVDYAPYDENNMNMRQAMAILQQDSALKTRGMSHPNAAQAEEFMKNLLNSKK